MNKFYMPFIHGRVILPAYSRVLFFLCFVFACNVSMAQLSLTNAVPSATIDFNTTIAGVENGPYAGGGFSAAPTAGMLNSNAWASTGWSDGSLAYGATQTGNDFGRGTTPGGIGTGGIYANTSGANPTLMLQPGGADFTPGTLTLRIKNNGTSLMNQLTVSYNIYVLNDLARSNAFNFSYSSDNVTYTQVSSMDYTTPGPASGTWSIAASKSTPVGGITGINIAPGAFFYIRWSGDDVAGNGARDEIGLDDISITGGFVGACTTPAVQASPDILDNILSRQMDVSFIRGQSTGGMIVVAVQGSNVAGATPALSQFPVSGVTYHANSNYGTGSLIGAGSGGNGYVVYNLATPSPIAGTLGTFTVTGLLPDTYYKFYFFEYNISVPCYDLSIIDVGEEKTATSASAISSASGAFRSKGNLDWANARSWESFTGGTWITSDLSPTETSSSIIVRPGHTMDITCPVKMDQVTDSGTVTLSNDGVININNGTGDDIDIVSGGILSIQTDSLYTTTFPSFQVASGTTINVGTGGKITINNGSSSSAYSELGYTATFVSWKDGSVFEWNSSSPFITAGAITYFSTAPAAAVPVFKVSKTPSLQPGAGANTVWNGRMEVNASLTLKLAGVKTFRYGIIGTADLYQDDNCGLFVVDGTTAQLGGAGSIHLNSGNMEITANAVTTLTSNKNILLTAGVGTLTVNNNGSLYCGTNILGGDGIFNLASGGTLGIGSLQGIVATGASGNIQTGTRTFDAGGKYIYNSASSASFQVTGNALPAIITGSLTISNTAPSNNMVRLTTDNTTVTTFNLANGLFEAGTAQHLIIANGGTINASGGNQAQTGAAGTIAMGTSSAGTEIINPGSALSLTNVDLNNGVTMGGGNTTINGILNIKSNGYVTTGSAPTYSSTPASTLLYSCGCNYGAGAEWYENNYGASPGVPHNVTLASGTSMNFTTAGSPREMRGDLTINASSIFALSTTSGGDLYIKGNWSRIGTGSVFNANDRQVQFNGPASSTISAVNGENFAYLEIKKDAAPVTVTLSNNVKVSKELKITSGTFALGNSDVTLSSTVAATASVPQMTGNLSYINGRFVVERYIDAGGSHPKSWQFLATPTNGGQTVNAAWQEGATFANEIPAGTAGYGTMLTSNISPLPAIFDALTPVGPSIKTYNPGTNGWDGILNTTGTPLYNQKGYMLFVRGNRSVITSGATATSTILRSRGKLFDPVSNIPPVTNVGLTQFESVGNPYASAIDFRNVGKAGSVQDVFYLWDPKLGSLYGAYQTFTLSGANYVVSPGGGSFGASGSINNTIQSGQAFFVHTSGGTGSVTFTENAKTTGSSMTFKPAGFPVVTDKQLRNNLYAVTTGGAVLLDGVLSQFDAGYSNAIDRLDAIKVMNTGENISIVSNNKTLVVERRNMVIRTDTVFYNLSQLKAQQYQFELTPDNLAVAGLEAFLEDNYLHTRINVSLSDTNRINFAVSNEPGSYASSRFRLVFLQKYIPVKYTAISAVEQDKNILVSWKVSDESVISHYEVERSADGINFTAIHTEAVGSNAGNYSWLDTNPLPGNNFYRIGNLSAGTDISYSRQVNVFVGKQPNSMVIYPNPVKDGVIGLQLYQLPAGTYAIKLFNSAGQQVLSTKLDHSGGNSLKQVNATGLASGVYKLEMTNNQGLKLVEKLVIQ